ncbi:unnamed protein product [Thlaspi arvense]|uniref:Maturase K n=1 Tax=Thlaspi arvense TaxID=13288 RepID=A0AAU9SVE1_THLAR|nr:unnamed protein product [Thlaspi arvense]
MGVFLFSDCQKDEIEGKKNSNMKKNNFSKEFYFLSLLLFFSLNDRFYCFNDRHPTAYIYPYRWWTECTRAVFMAEMKRELFLVFTRNEKPIVYKLVYLRWREVTGTELDGMTIFVSFHNSELRSELPWMRNNVFFSRYIPPKKSEDWSELCPPQSLWINPPKNMFQLLKAKQDYINGTEFRCVGSNLMLIRALSWRLVLACIINKESLYTWYSRRCGERTNQSINRVFRSFYMYVMSGRKKIVIPRFLHKRLQDFA